MASVDLWAGGASASGGVGGGQLATGIGRQGGGCGGSSGAVKRAVEGGCSPCTADARKTKKSTSEQKKRGPDLRQWGLGRPSRQLCDRQMVSMLVWSTQRRESKN